MCTVAVSAGRMFLRTYMSKLHTDSPRNTYLHTSANSQSPRLSPEAVDFEALNPKACWRARVCVCVCVCVCACVCVCEVPSVRIGCEWRTSASPQHFYYEYCTISTISMILITVIFLIILIIVVISN